MKGSLGQPLLFAATISLLLVGCSSADQPAASSSENSTSTSVVVSTTILGDVTQQIVECGGGDVTVLMPIGADPHDFSASSEQVASMATADLVVVNGLELEAGLKDSIANAAADGANVFEVAPLLDPIEFGAGGHSDEEAHSDEHAHEGLDPHFWFDMSRMATAAQLIGAELTKATGNQAYTDCAMTTADEIKAAEVDVRATLEGVPSDKRILITDHDAFGYLADKYGFEIAGVVIPGGSTLAQPSSSELASLVEVIKAEGVPAIFANSAEPTALVDAVAAETGSNVAVIPLYVGSLGGPDSPASTYIDYMKTNAQLIADGLSG